MRQTPPRRPQRTHLVPLLLSTLFAVLAAGCAQDVGEIDRTQANRVKRSVFEGDWYLARTVIDVPYTTSFTFIGESAELERVRWDVQEDLLIAYRVYDRVDGTDKAVTWSEAPYQGAPVVAFRIEKHFDIQREYNPATGEETNVLVENDSDRPWYERDYLRVDWSQNVLPSLTFLVNWYGPNYVVEAPLAHQVEDPAHPHHMVMGVKNDDGSWTDYRHWQDIGAQSAADYIEATVKVAVQPEQILIEDWYGNVYQDPACWYYLNTDCEHQPVTIRLSMMKVPENTGYTPLDYPDNEIARDAEGNAVKVSWDNGRLTRDPNGTVVHIPMFDKFGFFRVERYGYDPIYGETESSRTYLATRHNIWTPEGDAKPIVYYKSIDYPEWLGDAAAEIAGQWDEVFKKVVETSGKPVPDAMFELRDNSGQRIGDMRYNFLYYVPKPTSAGLLGYGPSLADPLTGEIVSAAAYVYGGPVREWAGMGRQVVDLLNGNITPEELGLGNDVRALIAKMKASQESGASKPGGADTPALSTPDLTMADLETFVNERVKSPRGAAVRKAGLKQLERPSGWYQSQLERVRGTNMEDLLINDEVKLLKGRKLVGPGDPLDDQMRSLISPVRWASKAYREAEKKRQRRLARKTLYMAEFVDDAVAGLALDLSDEGYASETVLRLLEEAIFKSTAEHEIGHTLGLRHNYAGSYDAMNFPREFWDQRGGSPQFPPSPRTPQQIAGRMDEYRYSSIMEYPARFNADLHGLGHYDEAAIMFAYGGFVQVFDGPIDEPLATGLPGVAGLQWPFHNLRHYTSIPERVGGVAGLFNRRYVPYADLVSQLSGDTEWSLWEVPFRFCSDEYDGATYWCAAYDAGMDPYEIVADAAERYRNYYFFQAFKRDRAGWDGWSYDGTLWYRYFAPMLNMYQHWAFLGFTETEQWDFWREDGASNYGIDDVDWELARDGGATLTAAARTALSFLIEVIATPQPGGYFYDPDNDLYFLGEEDPSVWPTCGPEAQEKDDPSLPCVDLNVELGDGRHSFTTYDPEDGYYFYERPLWVGAFTDKVLALEALADPTITFLGVNTSEDVQGYALGFFLYFPDILSKVSGGIIADTVKEFAGTTEFGAYYPPDPFNAAPTSRTIVDPDTWSTVQYYAIWLGMSGYASGYDNTFNDLMHVWYDGADGAQTLPDPNDPRVATWFDTKTQRTYRAVKHPDDRYFSVGYEMLEKANRLQQQVDNPGPDDDPAYAQILLNYQRELVELSIGMWELYGKLIF